MEENSVEKLIANTCGTECLHLSVTSKAQIVSIRKKAHSGMTFKKDGKIFFPVSTDEMISKDRLYGNYKNRHIQCLRKLKENPVQGVLPVLDLCNCTYSVPFLSGKELFDANTIPESFSAQTALLDNRQMNVSWEDFAKWGIDISSALLGLHQLQLAHGDVTVFNVMICDDGHAQLIDLENLNQDAEQRITDTIAFLFHVLLFLFDRVEEYDECFLQGLSQCIRNAPDEQTVLLSVKSILENNAAKLKKTKGNNRQLIWDFLKSLIFSETRYSEFFISSLPYIFRSSVYFQSDFLWLINYNMKEMREKNAEISEYLQTIERLNKSILSLKSKNKKKICELKQKQHQETETKETEILRELHFSSEINRIQALCDDLRKMLPVTESPGIQNDSADTEIKQNRNSRDADVSFHIYGSYHDGDLFFQNYNASLISEKITDRKDPGFKNILLVKGSDLWKYSETNLSDFDFSGAYFDLNESFAVADCLPIIRKGGFHCFARPNSREISCLKIFTDSITECMPNVLGETALAYAEKEIQRKDKPCNSTRKEQYHEYFQQESKSFLFLYDPARDSQPNTERFEELVNSILQAGKQVYVCSPYRDDPPVFQNKPVNFLFYDNDANPESILDVVLRQKKISSVIAYNVSIGAETCYHHETPFYVVMDQESIHEVPYCELKKFREADFYVTGYIVCSSSCIRSALQHIKLPPEKIVYFENGFDLQKYDRLYCFCKQGYTVASAREIIADFADSNDTK